MPVCALQCHTSQPLWRLLEFYIMSVPNSKNHHKKKRESKNKNGEPYPWGRKPYPQTYKTQAEKNKKTL